MTIFKLRRMKQLGQLSINVYICALLNSLGITKHNANQWSIRIYYSSYFIKYLFSHKQRKLYRSGSHRTHIRSHINQVKHITIYIMWSIYQTSGSEKDVGVQLKPNSIYQKITHFHESPTVVIFLCYEKLKQRWVS